MWIVGVFYSPSRLDRNEMTKWYTHQACLLLRHPFQLIFYYGIFQESKDSKIFKANEI